MTSTLLNMRTRIKTLTNNHISDADINALINRVHQEEVESNEWSYRQKRFLLTSGVIKTDGTVSATQNGTSLGGAGTAFTVSDSGKHIRIGATPEAFPIEILDVSSFPDAIGGDTIIVTNAGVSTISTTFAGILGTKAVLTITGGDLRYYYDGSTPTPTDGLYAFDGSQITITGHDNLDNLKMIAVAGNVNVSYTVEREAQDVTLAYPWPSASVTDQTYELFTRYYVMPSVVDDVRLIRHVNYSLTELSPFKLDLMDASRQERSDQATNWAKAGRNDGGQQLIELWPVTTAARHYEVEYLAGHVDLVNDTDRAIVPPAVIENRALVDTCTTMMAKTGDARWVKLAEWHEKRYEAAREKLSVADYSRFGIAETVFDLDAVGYSNNHLAMDYGYMVLHDV